MQVFNGGAFNASERGLKMPPEGAKEFKRATYKEELFTINLENDRIVEENDIDLS